MRNEINMLFTRRIKEQVFLLRYGVIITYMVLMTLILPRTFRLNYQYEIGKKWETSSLEAPFDFAIYKSQDSLERERELYSQRVMDIYFLDSTVKKEVLEDIKAVYNALGNRVWNYEKAIKENDSLRMSRIKGSFSQFELSPSSIDFLLQQSSQSVIDLARITYKEIESIYNKGFINLAQPNDSTLMFISQRYKAGAERYIPVYSLLSSKEDIALWLKQDLSNQGLERNDFISDIILAYIQPNLNFAAEETELARDQRKALVSPVKEKIKAGELIIAKGTIVTSQAAEKINSLLIELKQQNGEGNRFMTFFSQFLIVLMITGILLAYLWFNRPRLYFDYKKLALLLFTFLLTVAAMALASRLTNLAVRLSDISPAINLSYIYLAPACIVPIFISSFFDHRLALHANVLLALYGAVMVQQGLEFAFVQIMAGTVAVYSLRKLRKRDTFFITLGYIFLAYCVAYVAFNLLSKGSFAEINYRTLLIFGINVVLTVITYNLIYLMERIFGVTSDLTYLELLDTNYPLLQELSRKAPGTFQHSLQVANIAEATIKEIGGNALLTHVGALYHDIGKMIHANYFIENMSEVDKENNPHDKISCEQSAQIIIGHVKEGVKMAQKHHLPREIINFIEMHHGTTRVEYFYRRYLEQARSEAPEAEELFRYPGPLPNSKETAVLMIADSIEAASRSLKNPTTEKLKELVDSIINYKIRDHQLESSNLTFKDISIIRKILKKQLLSIFHGRIEYPKEEKVSSNS